MIRLSRLVLLASTTAALLSSVPLPAAARAASNIGHGTTCYNYPTVQPDGSITYQRVCFKRA